LREYEKLLPSLLVFGKPLTFAAATQKINIMKRFFTTILIAGIVITTTAQTAKTKKYIQKLDVKEIVENINGITPTEFWKAIHDNSNRVREIDKAYQKKDKAYQDACGVLAIATKYNSQHDKTISDFTETIEKLKTDLGIRELATKQPIRIIDNNTINASMDAFGLMRINKGAFQQLTYPELLAVCAHEMAHYADMHVVSGLYKKAKKQRRNNAWAEIGTSMAVGVFAATATYGSANGQDTQHFNELIANADKILQRAYDYADYATEKYKYRYSREEEIQADIIAYRFMEFVGMEGENMILALEKLKQLYGDTPETKHNDHPSIATRTEILRSLKPLATSIGRKAVKNKDEDFVAYIFYQLQRKGLDPGQLEHFRKNIKDQWFAGSIYQRCIEQGIDAGTQEEYNKRIFGLK